MPDTSVRPREEIPVESTWNSESVFESVQAWETGFRAVEKSLPELEAAKNRLGSGPGGLLAAFEAVEDIERRIMKLYIYASMSYSVETRNQAAAGLYDRVRGLQGRVSGAVAFLPPMVIGLGREKVDLWMEEEPRLFVYRHFFYDLFRRASHMRSAEVEELLGMLAGPFSSPEALFNSLSNADLAFRTAEASDGSRLEVTQGSIDAILSGSDREARKTAWESYHDGYLAFKNTFASNLSASVKQDVFISSARLHENTLEASLFEENLPDGVFYNVIEEFKKNLSVWHRYWRVRRKALAVEMLEPYDVWAPLGRPLPEIGYDKALAYITGGLAPLGDEYVGVLKSGCTIDRWVDIYPNLGKTSGAFSDGAYDTFPFICMSFTGDVFSVSTLAHELGHSMYGYYTNHSQPFVYSLNSIFPHEVASNFHQAMVRAYMLKTEDDPAFQLAVIEEAMSNFHRYFFVMPTLARFELEVHQRTERGEGITADTLNSLMADLFEEGYGGEMHVDRDRVGITWASFIHLFFGYYVFKYATGISAANAIAKRILGGVPGAADDYIRFISAGSSVYPLDALKLAGVDLASPEPIREGFSVLEGYVSRLEKLFGTG